MADTALLITGRTEPAEAPRMVEICRSFAFKLNVGNYESRDFFCSQKGTCTADQQDAMSAELADFCYEQVMKQVREYSAERKKQIDKRTKTA